MPFAIARRSVQLRPAALALLIMTPIASANLVFQTASGLNLAISDDAYNGTFGSMACVNIPVTDGINLDLRKVKVPIYNLATRDDHIAPARSAFYGSSFFGGKVTFVLSGSGHVAGVVNPPSRQKYGYWTGPAPKGDGYAAWAKKAKEHPGSWWPHWQKWIEAEDATRTKARPVGRGIEPAPGRYVRVKA